MHRRPLHRFTKRATYKQHINAKQREKEINEHLELPELPQSNTPPTPIVGGQPLEQRKHSIAEDLHDWILGGQDGLVNVLGSILGVAVVTTEKHIILVAGLASLFAESISMAAVAYTSVKASHSYYQSQKEARRKAIQENPVLQREILIDVYVRKGLTRLDAERIVAELTKDEEVWLHTIMQEHLFMLPPENSGPLRSSAIVGFASFVGSLIPVLPFFFLAGNAAIITSCVISVIMLFAAGAAAAKLTIGDWKKRGLEMAFIGATAAAVSFLIGYVFVSGMIPLT